MIRFEARCRELGLPRAAVIRLARRWEVPVEEVLRRREADRSYREADDDDLAITTLYVASAKATPRWLNTLFVQQVRRLAMPVRRPMGPMGQVRRAPRTQAGSAQRNPRSGSSDSSGSEGGDPPPLPPSAASVLEAAA